MKPRWTGHEEHRLRALANTNLSSYEIAKAMGRSRRSVAMKAHRMGIEIRFSLQSKLTDVQKADLRAWQKQREALGNCKSKAAQLGVSKATVIKWMREERA